MQDQHKTQHIGPGKARKGIMRRTFEDIEMKEACKRERHKERFLAMQQTMLQAVEQAVALPSPMRDSSFRQNDTKR